MEHSEIGRGLWPDFRLSGVGSRSCYIMLPFLGPSNERDTIGYLVADTAANPLIYIAPYDVILSDPPDLFWPLLLFRLRGHGEFRSIDTVK